MRKSLLLAGAVAAVALSGRGGYQLVVTTNDQRVVTVSTETAETTADVLTAVFADPEVASVEYRLNGNVAHVQPTSASTYKGGTVLENSQVRPWRGDALGTGPITIGHGSQLVQVDVDSMDITNKLVFSDETGWVLGFGNKDFILHSFGSTFASPCANLGRGNGALSMVSLALDGGDNEALNRIRLRGELKLNIRGGTVLKASPNARGPYFVETDAGPTTVNVLGDFAFDAAAGADAELGLPISLDKTFVLTNVLETVDVSNGSFEDKATGWESGITTGKAGMSLPGVLVNGSSTCTTWLGAGKTTPYGERFFCMRAGQAVWTKNAVDVAADGVWFVDFAYATRPDNKGNLIDTYVTLSNTTDHTEQTVMLPRNGYHAFRDVSVGPFDLKAGSYVLKVENGWDSTADVDDYGAMCYDNFRLARHEVVTNGLAFAKTGAGRLVCSDLTARNGAVEVRNGALRLAGAELDASRISVSDGATVELQGGAYRQDTTVDVAAGGTLALADTSPANCVENGGFEVYPDTAIMDLNALLPVGWSLVTVIPNANNQDGKNSGGHQGYGGNVTANGPKLADGGTYSIAIREQCRASRKVNVPAAGTYLLTFWHAKRKNYSTDGMVMYPAIDATDDKTDALDRLTPSDAAFAKYGKLVELTAGEHTLSFYVDGTWTGSTGPLCFIDNVALSRVDAVGDVSDATFDLKSGATLRLDNIRPIHIQNFRVDGVRIDGAKRAIRAAGVTVAGDGAIQVGDKQGLMLLLR